MKIAFCSSEVFPFAKTGGLADVCGALPLALEKLGTEIIVFLPHYQFIDTREFQIQRVHEGVSKTSFGKNITVYLIENEKYFYRDGLYGDRKGDYADNLDRFQYFSLHALELLKEFNEKIDIVHCHDWQTALIPVYLKEKYKDDPFFAKTKSLLTLHNLAFQGVFPKDEYLKIGLSERLFSEKGFEFFGKINLLKAGIIFSDAINTVSPQYAKEILTKEFGCGLEGVIKSRKDQVTGILNGLDYDIWNPKTDIFVEKKYSSDNFSERKAKNKTFLQKKVGLPMSPEVPIFGFVGRLSYQKGIDLVLEAINELLALDLQIVIQGTGNGYHAQLEDLTEQNPKQFAVCLEFDERTAHQIYAGADMFLMPSVYEPCGLSQMISLCYGTIPVVYKTGGLADTVKNFDHPDKLGNGFVFDKYTKKDFIETIKTAVKVYHQKKQFGQLVNNGFAADFSWEKSAGEYKKIYQCLLSG